jgi:hypothetical protein
MRRASRRVLVVRTLFCLFADDVTIFEKGAFHDLGGRRQVAVGPAGEVDREEADGGRAGDRDGAAAGSRVRTAASGR